MEQPHFCYVDFLPASRKLRYVAIIPALNETDCIGGVVAALGAPARRWLARLPSAHPKLALAKNEHCTKNNTQIKLSTPRLPTVV